MFPFPPLHSRRVSQWSNNNGCCEYYNICILIYIYCADPKGEFFSIKFHHGGVFVKEPYWGYKGGEVHFFDQCNVDEISMLELEDMAEKLGWKENVKFKYKIPRVPMSKGIKELSKDLHVMEMTKYIAGKQMVIDVYIEDCSGSIEDCEIGRAHV